MDLVEVCIVLIEDLKVAVVCISSAYAHTTLISIRELFKDTLKPVDNR